MFQSQIIIKYCYEVAWKSFPVTCLLIYGLGRQNLDLNCMYLIVYTRFLPDQ